jgi:hypothetical protein
MDSLQGLADTMRAMAGGFPNMDEVRFYLGWAQRLRDTMLRERFGLSRRVQSIRHMIHAMVVSGLLRKRDCMKVVLLHSIRMMVKEKAVQEYYVDMLHKDLGVPSTSTLYWHRLTIHMATCLVSQFESADQWQASGVVSWGTMDSSPQGSHNWLMVGFTSVRADLLVDICHLAHRMWLLRDSDEEDDLAVSGWQSSLGFPQPVALDVGRWALSCIAWRTVASWSRVLGVSAPPS